MPIFSGEQGNRCPLPREGLATGGYVDVSMKDVCLNQIYSREI